MVAGIWDTHPRGIFSNYFYTLSCPCTYIEVDSLGVLDAQPQEGEEGQDISGRNALWGEKGVVRPV